MKIFNITYLEFCDIFKTKIIATTTEEAIRIFNDKHDGQAKIEKISYASIPKKKNSFGEYVVQIYVNGKRQKGAEYFATDFDDAIATTEIIILNY